MPTLVIQTTSGVLSPSGTSLFQMPCLASPAIDPQIINTLENMSMTSESRMTPQAANGNEHDRNNNNNNKNGMEIVSAAARSPVKVTKLTATWTQLFVSPDFRVHGENFDQHLHDLLMPSERRVIKKAMENYAEDKSIEALLGMVNPVLDNPHKWPIWYFIVQSLKGRERMICRRRLADLLQSQSPDDGKSVSADGAVESNSTVKLGTVPPGTAKGRIRRRRTMRAAYNRGTDTDLNDPGSTKETESPSVPQSNVSNSENQSEDASSFRVRRIRRRRTVTGVNLASQDMPESSCDILRIDEPGDEVTHLPAANEEEIPCTRLDDPVARNAESAPEPVERIVRRRRRDPLLRRLQSADFVHDKEISLERDMLTTRNSLPVTAIPVQTRAPVGRDRRRRSFRQSLDGAIGVTKAPLGCHERAALVVRRRAKLNEAGQEEMPETNIDDIDAKEVADVILSGNGNNNNRNNLSLSIEEDSYEQTTDEQEDSESNMSLKSPLSMSRLRSSFRISSKSKNKELSLPKDTDTTTSSNDEKVKTKKIGGRGLLERMGMGKKQQSGSESSSKEESKSKKLFGRSKSGKKETATSDTQTKKQADKSQNKSPVVPPVSTDKGPTINSTESVRTPPPETQQSMFVTDMEISPDLGQDDDKKKGYMCNLKKRLTFSRPPRNPDTEAFLSELSAQFDQELNILDDLAMALEETSNTTQQKYGSKWSYLPNGEMPDAHDANGSFFKQESPNDLSDLGLSDIEDDKDVTPPFPLTLDSGDESGVGTMGTLSTPSPTQPHYSYRDRELEWERERLNRRRRRKQAFESLTSQHSGEEDNEEVINNTSSPPIPNQQPTKNHTQQAKTAYQDDEMIYDVPKTARRTRSRKSRREAMSRSVSVPTDTSYPPSTRATRRRRGPYESESMPRDVDRNYVDMLETTHIDRVSLNGSPTEQTNFFDRAKQRGYRVSGVVGDIGNVFSEAEESLQHDQDVVDSITKHRDMSVGTDGQTASDTTDFAGEVTVSSGRRSRGDSVTHLPSSDYVYVDADEVYAEPRSSGSTAVRLRNRSRRGQNDVLEGDLSFTDINALLQAYDDDGPEHPPEIPPLPNSEGPPPIPPPPPPPPPPLAPPPPPPPPPGNDGPASPVRMNVKRINWQKIEPTDLKETVWGQIGEDFETINDVVKYLDLEQHFATKKAKELKRLSLPVKRDVVSILSHKKAYNISILLAHLKMPVNELRTVLLSGNDHRLDASQYKQMLMYAPDDDEATKLLVYRGEISKLNEADQFAKKMVTIPGFRLRLQALLFKKSFADREEDVRANLEHLQQASIQLRKSKKLAKILEFVLAMGNYMNRGHNRISKATGFKIQFLADMDSTKTSDNKLTFLHILARAVYSKFPELCNFAQDLKDVRPASRVAYPAVFQELQEMRKEWVDIRDRMPEALTKAVRGDRFKNVMEHYLVQTNAALKRLELLLASTMKEFSKVARYFGENSKTVGMQHFFNIFGEFIVKFEKADREIKFIMENKAMNLDQT